MLPSGRWQYLRGPVGLSATSDDWCRKSNFVIKGNKNARKIADDILCWGATMQELMIKLDTILMRCKAIGITLSIKKFKISKEVAFAGYVIQILCATTCFLLSTDLCGLSNGAMNGLDQKTV
jgi:hypothetical protein